MVSTTTAISSLYATMAELFRDQLNDLRPLLRHIPDAIPLPLPSEIVYPFVGYTIDEYWFDKIESEEGVVNRDLELAFADRVAQNDTERLISFHECEPRSSCRCNRKILQEGLRERSVATAIGASTCSGHKVFVVEEDICFLVYSIKLCYVFKTHPLLAA